MVCVRWNSCLFRGHLTQRQVYFRQHHALLYQTHSSASNVPSHSFHSATIALSIIFFVGQSLLVITDGRVKFVILSQPCSLPLSAVSLHTRPIQSMQSGKISMAHPLRKKFTRETKNTWENMGTNVTKVLLLDFSMFPCVFRFTCDFFRKQLPRWSE
jgi:hypothetical protein